MFRCDHHHQGAYCVSLLKLQCHNIWLKYIIVVNLVVWLRVLSGPCWRISQILNSAAHIHQHRPDNTRSHTARLTKMMYFNQMLYNTVTLASSHSMLPDDGDHTKTCWSYFNFNVNFSTP